MEKIQETDEGYYVQHGDVLEWRWKDSPKLEQNVVTTEDAPKPKRKAPARKAAKK